MKFTYSSRYIHLLSLFICCLIYLDHHYSPESSTSETVLDYECNTPKYRNRKNARTFITTKTHTYDISLRYCIGVSVGVPITVSRSAVSNAIMSIAVHDQDEFVYDVSFFTGRTGWLYVSFIALLSIIFFVFFHRIGNEVGKERMVYFLLVCAIALLVQHIFNVF